MKKICSQNKNPLVRNGINQSQRLLPAFKEGYVLADERNIEDIIVFARKYSAFIKYYNSQNYPDGTWEPFFTTDVSSQLAVIVTEDVFLFNSKITNLFNGLRSKQKSNKKDYLRENFGFLFGIIFTLSKAFDEIGKKLDKKVTLGSLISNMIKTRLAKQLNRLIAYNKAALEYSPELIDESKSLEFEILGYSYCDFISVVCDGLSVDWITLEGNTNWSDYYNSIEPDYSIYGDEGSIQNLTTEDINKRINHAVNHNLFTGIFSEYSEVLAKINKEAKNELAQTLKDWKSHEPHYALFLAFLKLFAEQQKELNKFTDEHLNFYFREALKIEPKQRQGNYAHLLFELAKGINSYNLKKGTIFKGGKDKKGKEILYSLVNELTVNKTKITSLKGLYLAGVEDKTEIKDYSGKIFAADVINSSDGIGGELKTTAGEWHPFVNKVYENGILTDIFMPEPEIGFAISSHYLLLSEGQRRITLTLSTNNKLLPKNFNIKALITTEKSWFEVPEENLIKTSDKTNNIIFKIELNPDVPAITKYNQKIHGGNYLVKEPVIKFILANEGGNDQYKNWLNKEIKKISLKVNVGSEKNRYSTTGLKNILAYNDSGPVDSSKPFLPFGTAPKKGASLIIGSEEIFCKKNIKIQVSVEWADLPSWRGNIDFNLVKRFYPSAQLKFLENGVWKDSSIISIMDEKENQEPEKINQPGEMEIFWGKNPETYFPSKFAEIPEGAIIEQDNFKDYNVSSKNGFLKIELNDSFQHDEYLDKYLRYLIDLANKENPVKPIEPYTPKIKSLYISYEALTESDYTKTDEKSYQSSDISFIHLGPFGIAEKHKYLTGESNISLMPEFVYTENGEKVFNSKAEFFIGLDNLEPPQNISLLFQVLDGSTNPLISKPKEHVFWSYLSNNIWKNFPKENISDETNQLIQTGIITFSIPEDAEKNNTIMPDGKHWLKASIKEKPDAVCYLIDVEAQASKVELLENGNSDELYIEPLKENSISKLKEPVSDVKKIIQPFPTFGGKPKETDINYRIRVSERLRHKNRAITIWDYEHLILEKFPQIYKVRVLNHTRFEPDGVYNEIAPGYVTIITVPNLKNNSFSNPLTPYTDKKILEEIKKYLEGLSSCHVTINVENPMFEQVRVKSTIKFHTGFDVSHYKKLLKAEITEFLSPWAFSKGFDLNFGISIHKSSILDFIEERNYVDFITNLEVFHTKYGEKNESSDSDMIKASTSAAVLVSANSENHNITIIDN